MFASTSNVVTGTIQIISNFQQLIIDTSIRYDKVHPNLHSNIFITA